MDIIDEDPVISEIGTFSFGFGAVEFDVDREVFPDGGVELHLVIPGDREQTHGREFNKPEFATAVNAWLKGMFPDHAAVDFRESGAQGEGYVAMCEGGF